MEVIQSNLGIVLKIISKIKNHLFFPYQKKKKIPVTSTGNAIYWYSTYGPTFGHGHDVYIADNSNTSNSSYSNFSNWYKTNLYQNGTN